VERIIHRCAATEHVRLEHPLNITDTAHAVAHEYDGGCESLAPRIGMSANILRNKVNPNNTTHHLTLVEAVRMSVMTQDRRIVDAFARELGLVCIELPEPENCADADVIELVARTWETNGDIGREINAIFADGLVEQREIPPLKARALKHVRTVLGLVSRIAGMAEK
jgi:hypothetical protein